MSELNELITQRDKLLNEIREIEQACEGVENENNAKLLQELNLEQAKLTAQKNELQTKLDAFNEKISEINSQIAKLSETGVNRILNAIKNQRWYFFKNHTQVLMDRNSGLLWADLDYFAWCPNKNDNNFHYGLGDAKNVVNSFDGGGFSNWCIPKFNDFKFMIADKSFPFKKGDHYYIMYQEYWYCNMQGYSGDGIDLDDLTPETGVYFVIPCNDSLVKNSDYREKFSNSNVYTERERLQFTLDLFVQNKLLPIFNDPEITELFKKIYFEKPVLLEKLRELQNQIDELQDVKLLSSEFDYSALLVKYDVKAIDSSVIKYFQAVQSWCNELMDKLDYYEEQKENIINDFNVISLQLSKKYNDNPNLTEPENSLLKERQKFFQKKFSLGMNSVKNKILALKTQADNLEYKLDEIDNNSNSMSELAKIESETRASFGFIAENTGKIIRNALLKIEFFEKNKSFVQNAIKIWSTWTEDYRVFKTTYRDEMKNSCEEDGIESEIWEAWYSDWQKIRFKIETKIQPLIEYGLRTEILVENSDSEMNVIERLVKILEAYKKSIDKFFKEERKGIYQKFAFVPSGDLQDKFESESGLYKCTYEFQSALQEIIFACVKSADRFFILNWASDLLDIQIDEILKFVADKELQKISTSILEEFSQLKLRNYDSYLSDARAYSEEQSRREKQYNSLIFKMRKDLEK